MQKSRVGRIETEKMKASHLVKNQIRLNTHKAMTKPKRNRDKSDFSTVQNVFDRKTLSTLSKLETNGFLGKLGMCISTGKEANVYESFSADGGQRLAVKVYKTMVTNFKDRTDYIQGDFRFKRVGRQVRTNPHKITALWAEKEFRNLKRMKEAGILCPEAVKVKENILVMGMLGRSGRAFPRLRDVRLGPKEASNVYLECLFLLRKMFVKVDSVHGDFSEFNLLFDQERQQLFVIDVSQSVHSHHPLAFEFLKRDIYNVNLYFSKLGIPVFPLAEMFQFVVDREMGVEAKRRAVEKMMGNSLDNMELDPEKKKFEVFLGMNIPTNLYEMDLDRIAKEMDSKDLQRRFYSKMIGLTVQEEEGEGEGGECEMGGVEEIKEEVEEMGSLEKGGELELELENEESTLPPQVEEVEEGQIIETKKDDQEPSQAREVVSKLEELVLMDDVNKFGEVEGPREKERKVRGDALYGHLTKKERKQLVKEQKREKRKTKMPKKLKKKLTHKKTRGNKK